MRSGERIIRVGDDVLLHADLDAAVQFPIGSVVVVDGSGSSRNDEGHRVVGLALQAEGIQTVTVDLLTPREQSEFLAGGSCHDIRLLADRIGAAIDWLGERPELDGSPIGLLASSTASAGALVAAARRPDSVTTIVSRAGRPDLAGESLLRVKAPCLFIVEEHDTTAVEVNRRAMSRIGATTSMEIVPSPSQQAEETFEKVAAICAAWFRRYFAPMQQP